MKKLIKDMALSRTDAMDRCISLGKKFIEHFDKLFKEPNSNARNHWVSEMKNWYKAVKEIKLKQTNKPILDGELRDWFFTAGANPQDFMTSPTTEELSIYDAFTSKVISGNSIESALRSLRFMDRKLKDKISSAMINELKNKVEEFKRRGYDEEDLKITVDGNKVWFTGELSYNTHEKLANELDKIVAKYDDGAYFDADTSGRWSATFFDKRVKDSIIPNSAKTLEVTLKRDISNGKAGDKVILKRNERGQWSDGKSWYPVGMLRIPEVCEVKVIDGLTAKERKELDYLRRKEEVANLDDEEMYRITELELKMDDSRVKDVRTVQATQLKRGDIILDDYNKPYKITSIDFERSWVSLYADNLTGNGNARFTFDNTEKVKVKDMADFAWATKGQRVSEHNEYHNRYPLEVLKRTFNKVMAEGNDPDSVKIVIGQLAEIKKDYQADMNNPKLNEDETKEHYRKYKNFVEGYRNSNISKDFKNAVEDFISSIRDSKIFTVKYKDRKFRVKARDHKDAANKVIKKVKDDVEDKK